MAEPGWRNGRILPTTLDQIVNNVVRQHAVFGAGLDDLLIAQNNKSYVRRAGVCAMSGGVIWRGLN